MVERAEGWYVEAAGGDVVLADVTLTVQKSTCTQHNAATFDVLAASGDHSLNTRVSFSHFKLLDVRRAKRRCVSAILDDREIGIIRHLCLHELLV